MDDSTTTGTTASISGLINDTTYYWRVRAKGAGVSSPWSNIRYFKTVIVAPDTPTVISPVKGAVAQTMSLTLDWSDVRMAASYEVRVSTDAKFGKKFKDTITAGSYQYISGLASLTTYYWRVRAINTAGSSAWSTVWNFTTAALSAPVLVLPSSGSANQSPNVSFVWNTVSGATNYTLQFATDSNFVNIFTQDSLITDTVKVDSGFSLGTTYYWRVRAKGAGGVGAWSETRKFTTVTTAVLPVTASQPRVFSISGSSGFVRYSLPQPCRVSLKYYDLRGRLIATLVNSMQSAGEYSLSVKNALPSRGAYVRVFEAGSFIKRDLVAVMQR
jgi:hypothetical protein